MAQSFTNHGQNLADNAVTNPKLRDSAALSVIGRSANSTGDPADIAGATLGQVLQVSTGPVLSFAPGVILLDSVGQFDLVNDLNETAMYSYSVPAGILGTNRAIRLSFGGDYFNNSAATRTLQLKVKYGSTTLYDDLTVATATSAVRRPVGIEIVLGNTGTTNSQFMWWTFIMGNVAGTTAGLGDLATAALIPLNVMSGTSAEDSTLAQTFSITATHATNNASLSFRRQYATLILT